jgi:hypothetical protein
MSGGLRRHVRALVVLVGLGLLAVPVAVGRPAALPNPCTLLPAAPIAAALKLPAGAHPVGKLELLGNKPLAYKFCVYTRGTARLQIEVAPKAFGSGGSGGAPGMVTSTPTGFGPHAHAYSDANPKYAFSSITFIKGSYWGSVWANGKVQSAQVLALAHLLYAKL